MSDTYTDLLACEDLLLFASAAISATGQREFHSCAGDQRLSLDFLHDYVHHSLPHLYAATLALHVNDHNAMRIVHTLLSRPRTDASADERARENALIRRRLARTPPQRVYRLFRRLAAERVNNRRTRATIRHWLEQRPDLTLDAVKYRKGLRAPARGRRPVPLLLPQRAPPPPVPGFPITARARPRPPLRAGPVRPAVHRRRGVRRPPPGPPSPLPGTHPGAHHWRGTDTADRHRPPCRGCALGCPGRRASGPAVLVRAGPGAARAA